MKKIRRSHVHQIESLEKRCLLAGDLMISEFLASNGDSILDEDGDSSDWIEFHNPTDEPIDLAGWRVTDDPDNLSKWQFPAVTLGPREYSIVFASGKDRSDPDSELHTSFRISAGGEFLAIVNPAGEVTQSFGDEFPPQERDVSFGFSVQQQTLVSGDANGRYLVPTADNAGDQSEWTKPEFDDATWKEGTGALGFDRRLPIVNAGFEEGDLSEWQAFGGTLVVSDSIRVSPAQGQFQAAIDAFSNNKTRAQMETFLGLERFSLDTISGGDADRGSVIRRTFEVEAGDKLEVDWNFLTNEPVIGGSNDIGIVSIVPGPGAIVLASASDDLGASESAFIRESGYSKFEYTFEESGLVRIGFGAVNLDNANISSVLLVDDLRINAGGEISELYPDLIGTNVESDLYQSNTSIWSRYDFSVDAPANINSLLIRARYEDGANLSLNGSGLVKLNAPGDLAWNSAALSDRAEDLSLDFETLYLPAAPGLQESGNLLAVQGLTDSINDLAAIFETELIGLGPLTEMPAYFQQPTPGLPNFSEPSNVVQDVSFSHDHGLYNAEFDLLLTTPTPNAKIMYSLDGSHPGASNGIEYTGPIRIDGTSVVRAVAVLDGFDDSDAKTNSYIFLDDTITQSHQDGLDRGFPDTWGPFEPPRWPEKEADYEMDTRIIGPNDLFGGKYASRVRDGLTAVPTLSLVMEVDDFFGPTGIHGDPRNRGVEWERPTSVELIYPDGTEGFQVDAGIRIQGGVSRVIAQKQSFRLLFKSEYGPSRLEFPLFGPDASESHDSITLRSTTGEFLLNNGFHPGPGIHYIRDEFLRRSQLATGNVSSQGTFMHLYINGIYWGLYNPVERIDGQFGANYFGGDKEDYDVLNARDFINEPPVSPVEGTADMWNLFTQTTEQMRVTNSQEEKTALYLQLQGLNEDGTRNPEFPVLLDRDNLIDYLITQVYTRNTDWPVRNYYVLRQRGPDSTGFKFLTWDGEFTLDSSAASKGVVTSIDEMGVGIVYQGLRTSQAFRVDFSDRVQEHFSPGGAFYVNSRDSAWDPDKPENNIPAARYAELAEMVEDALVPESARWGDQTVINWTPPFQNLNPVVFTVDERWRPDVELNLENFFPSRSSTFERSLIRDDHYRPAPEIQPPVNPDDTEVTVTMQSSQNFGGNVYYTLNGNDPKLPNGEMSPQAVMFESPINLSEETTVRARTVNEDGEWSSIATVTYLTTTVPADADNIRISEINYNPHDPLTQFGEDDVDANEFEFVEIANIGARPVDLMGVQLVEVAGKGVEFTFGPQVLDAGEFAVIPRNLAAFQSRYGNVPNLAVAADGSEGIFAGGLSNAGELITILDARGRMIQQFSYSDAREWPGRADGNASSLEVINLDGDYDSAENYRSSSEFGGSPGLAGLGPDNRVVINELLTNTDAPQRDQIELLNRSINTVDTSGWYISDSNENYLKFAIPANSILHPGDHLLFDETQLDFRLNSVRGDDVYLIESAASGKPERFVDRVEFDATAPGVTLGRLPNGSGRLYPMAENTLGRLNTGPIIGDIVVTEIQYAPGDPDGNGSLTDTSMEYVELYNRTDAEQDISGWRIRGDREYEFPTGTTIGPAAVLTVVAFDPADFQTRVLFDLLYGSAGANLMGPAFGALGDGLGEIRLMRPEQTSPEEPDIIPFSLVDEVQYNDVAPWPVDVAEANRTINRVDPIAFGNNGLNWNADRETPGRVDFTVSVDGDVTGDRLVDSHDIDRVCRAIREGDSTATFDLNGDGVVNVNDQVFLVQNILLTGPGDGNLDGTYDSSDLVIAFVAGEYEDGLVANSGWRDGDWNCDGEFNTKDLVNAFRHNAYSRRAITTDADSFDLGQASAITPTFGAEFEHAARSGNRSIRNPPWQQRARYQLERTQIDAATIDRLFDVNASYDLPSYEVTDHSDETINEDWVIVRR